MEKIDIREAEKISGSRKVSRSFLNSFLNSLVDEGMIDLSKEEIETIVIKIEEDYEYEFYVEYLPKGILEFLEDFQIL